jgi:protein-disulfide isomerase
MDLAILWEFGNVTIRFMPMLIRMLALLLVVVALAGGSAAAHRGPGAAQGPVLTAAQLAGFESWWDGQPKIPLPFDNDGAKVLIVEFTDLQCPFCRQKYVELKPILEKYAARPQDVKFIMKHWPINSNCNAGAARTLHPAACEAAAAVVMGRPKKTADLLVDWLYMHQDGMTGATVRKAAAEVGKVTDFDAQYARAIQEVKTDAAIGSSLRVDGTPAFFVNGRRVPGGGLAPNYFEALIELEIKRAK